MTATPRLCPTATTVPLFERYESFYRLLVRATNPRPAQRFSSVDEMANQCRGVLHEILAEQTGVPRPRTSLLFSMPRSTFGADLALRRTDVFVDGRRHIVRLSTPVSPVHCRHRRRPRIRTSTGEWTGMTPSPRWMQAN